MGLARAIDTDELTLESRHRIAHHENLGDLAKSASEACRICLRFWDVFNHDIKRHISDDEIIKAQVLLKSEGCFSDEYYLTYFNFRSSPRLEEYHGSGYLLSLSVVLNPRVIEKCLSSIVERINLLEMYFFLSRCESECIISFSFLKDIISP